jgi:uncharacterized protein YcnI
VRARTFAATAFLALAFPAAAPAHVEIASTEVGDGAVFTATSPNENQTQEMTGLRLTIPNGLTVEAIGDAPGFNAEIVRDQTGKAVAVSWQGGSLPPEHMGLFQFSGALEGTDHVRLNGIQTFADGSTKTWTPEIALNHTHGRSDTLARVLAGAALVVALAAAGLALAGRRRRPAS